MSQDALYREDIKAARPYARKLHRKQNKDQGGLEYMGKVLQYYAYSNTSSGVALFKRRLDWTFGMWNQRSCFHFYTGAWALFKGLSKKRDKINMELPKGFEAWKEDGVYETAVLADWFYKKSADIAERFDKRNKTSYYKDYLGRA